MVTLVALTCSGFILAVDGECWIQSIQTSFDGERQGHIGEEPRYVERQHPLASMLADMTGRSGEVAFRSFGSP